MRILPILLVPLFAACTPGVTVEKHNYDLNQLYTRINKLEEEKNVSSVKMSANNNKLLIVQNQLIQLQKDLKKRSYQPVQNHQIATKDEGGAELRAQIEAQWKTQQKKAEIDEPIILTDSMLNKPYREPVPEVKTVEPVKRVIKPLPRKPKKVRRIYRKKRFSRKQLKLDYDAALALYRAGKYSESKDSFGMLIEKYSSYRSSLTDNFYYWIGENYLSLKDIPLAREYFNIVLKRYPRENKVPDSLLKLGMMMELEKKQQNAIKYYQQIVQNYPATESGKAAAERLQNLKQ